MKVCHWTLTNGSGMHRVAASIVAAEIARGLDSVLANPQDATTFDVSLAADVHVSHTHVPDEVRRRATKPLRLVWVGHGTPEHVFQSAVEEGTSGRYGHGDGFMLVQAWLQTADACVTFWPRHQAIWQSLCDKGRVVDLVPLGVEHAFWHRVPSQGKYDGSPSLFTAENPHYIKWPLDLFLAWPWVYPHLAGAPRLHAMYLARDQHRWFFPLVNRNGASYAAHLSPLVLSPEGLRNACCSVDFVIGLVRYGDFNRLSLEANACQATTISYRGNPHADFWVSEGDQRTIAAELVEILSGRVEPRAKTPVPDISVTAAAMQAIYERIAA